MQDQSKTVLLCLFLNFQLRFRQPRRRLQVQGGPFLLSASCLNKEPFCLSSD